LFVDFVLELFQEDGVPMSKSATPEIRGKQAIVIGGSIAGLLAAHILTSHFEQVTIIERDHYPEEPGFRPGTPQSRHVHIFLIRGVQILEEFFPGFKEKLMGKGALSVDMLKDNRVRVFSGWLPRETSHLHTIACTRYLVEWQIRQEVLSNSRIQVIEGHDVIGLLCDNEQNIAGVQFRARSQHATTEEPSILPGELVVDASGRDSHAPQWLTALGYSAPRETIVNPYLGYATSLYAFSPTMQRDWQGIAIQYDLPQNRRGGTIAPTEDGHWLVLLAGISKDYPPTEEAAFLEFAKGLPDAALYEAIRDAKLLSPIYGYRRTENRLRHYEKLPRLPEGFMLIGDAVCALNPLYGQGMTVALLGATTLKETLRGQRENSLAGLTRRFQRSLARVNAIPWQLATASDSRAPIVEGGNQSWMSKLSTPYFNGLMEILPSSLLARRIFMEVVHLVRPPVSLLHPGLILAVLLRKRQRRYP
jgi:2-polyprenyl-6-methoxyphenol hydroxylase-like FAD-dependent oxidoreductase